MNREAARIQRVSSALVCDSWEAKPPVGEAVSGTLMLSV
jgi:hypothetical protein